MPPPKKLDLIGDELRGWLEAELKKRGFAEIIEVTDALNARLQAAGKELRVGKSAVGDYNKLLKDQREAASIAGEVMKGFDLESADELQKTLYHAIMNMTLLLVQQMREADQFLSPKDMSHIGSMMKNVVSATGIMERLKDDERQRIKAAAKAEAVEEQKAALEAGVASGAINADAAQAARQIMGFE